MSDPGLRLAFGSPTRVNRAAMQQPTDRSDYSLSRSNTCRLAEKSGEPAKAHNIRSGLREGDWHGEGRFPSQPSHEREE